MVIEKVLIIDEDEITRNVLCKILKLRHCDVFLSADRHQALEQIQQQPFDLIFTDIASPLSDSKSLFSKTQDHLPIGLEILKKAKEQNLQALVILMTAYASVEAAVEAMKLGAFHYLIKPFSQETIEAMLAKAREQIALIQENRYLKEEISTRGNKKTHRLIAESEPMKKILNDINKVSKSTSSVFISGESGTGKEMIAQAIHFQSYRATQPFIKVNCAAIPTSLLESEFFGHEKGSFTGAINKKLGRFELADKGTLLLDEVSEIPLELQAKLLRAVQEMEFERVGGIRPICVDIRLISTSNRPMKETVEKKLFREDLYYRLNVVPVHLPPLRERKEDIFPLAQYFFKRLCEENGKPLKSLSLSAQKKLLEYHWPGNIRELANVIERAVVMNSADTIEEDSLQLDLPIVVESNQSSALPLNITLQELEKRMILQTLAQYQDNRTKTAQALGISVRTLRNKLYLYRA